MVIKFRKEEDAHKLLKRVKKMREEIEEVEDILDECMEDDEYVDYRDDDDYIYDDRRMRRNERMNGRRYRRGRM